MPFRFCQLVHDVDHIPFIDERCELYGKAGFVQIHIIEFRRLEPVHEVLTYQVLAIRKKVLLPFTPDTRQHVCHVFHASDITRPGIAHHAFELFQVELVLLSQADCLDCFQITAVCQMGDMLGIFGSQVEPGNHGRSDIFRMNSPHVDTLCTGQDRS